MDNLRIGLMGFGQVGRQIYRLALDDERYSVVAVSDIGRPEILHHLLTKSMARHVPVSLEGRHLVGRREGPGCRLIRVAINGFGRIGRAVFRIAERSDEIEIVAINDLFDRDALAYLLTYDTVMGRFEGGVAIEDGDLVTPHTRARMVRERNRGRCLGRN